ncbi:hypothetical protein BJ138DRAFT_1004241 [Hygrophoropsis aurantiaca]|uniref:Uncharacterized protein n=1 Tax=Hygrophoropsis aurantiaca TaxID=72124 RepID=A0ACB8AHX3_9AGAM|nr:hypothetical protein BJ138DRAFT_1004241 [Hygrophoropsis aurantiaca]
MDMQFDESWCPACDRQIMPKRFLVPVAPPPPPPQQQLSPAAPPSSPSTSPTKNQQSDNTSTRTTRSKTGTIRTKGGGLVQGTGRVKPNGAIKRSDSSSGAKSRASSQQPAPKPAPPVKHRTVIDQSPIPLYCSDECRMRDINRFEGAFPIDYNPERASPPLPPVPHNSFSCPSMESEDESSTGSGSSLESHFSSSSESITVSPSMATLAAMYDFTLPPPAPICSVSDTKSSGCEYRNDYQSGVMMAARRIEEALGPKAAPKRNSYRLGAPQPRKPIPGWTDGSDAWRSAVYSFSAPSDKSGVAPTTQSSFAASSNRGVPSTLNDASKSSSSSSLPIQQKSSRPPPRSSQSYTDDLYAKYTLSFSRRSESRTTLFPPASSASTQSLPPLSPTSTTSSRRCREVSLLKPGAEGRLLVPDVKLRRPVGGSAISLSSSSVCSPLSRYPSEISEDSMWSEQRDTASETLSVPPRPAVTARSWSYDNMKTYPVMPLPSKKEKRLEKRLVDGKEQEVEIEVEVVQPLKRLFLFNGKETSPERRW